MNEGINERAQIMVETLQDLMHDGKRATAYIESELNIAVALCRETWEKRIREECAEIVDALCSRRHGSEEPCGDACCDFCAAAHFIRLGEDPPPFTGLESPALSKRGGDLRCPKCNRHYENQKISEPSWDAKVLALHCPYCNHEEPIQ